jgi:hypothetical protein
VDSAAFRTPWVNDGACVSHSFGAVAQYLQGHGCHSLTRTLITLRVAGRLAVVSVARVQLTDPADDQDFIRLISSDGSGDIRTLVDDGITYSDGPKSFASLPTFRAREVEGGAAVDVFEAMWRNGDTYDHDPALQPVLDMLARAVN